MSKACLNIFFPLSLSKKSFTPLLQKGGGRGRMILSCSQNCCKEKTDSLLECACVKKKERRWGQNSSMIKGVSYTAGWKWNLLLYHSMYIFLYIYFVPYRYFIKTGYHYKKLLDKYPSNYFVSETFLINPRIIFWKIISAKIIFKAEFVNIFSTALKS